MCTAATYKTKDFYFGRTLDYEFSYGDEVTVTPRNFPLVFRNMGEISSHYAISTTKPKRAEIILLSLSLSRGYYHNVQV